MDIWQYILLENIEIPNLYFSHKRRCYVRNGSILSENNFQDLKENEEVKEMQIRFRTMGDITITGAVESDADSLEKIIGEVAAARNSERGERADDQRSDTAMEDRKKEGYF
jgi:sulfate adenylyltransferase subunit 2